MKLDGSDFATVLIVYGNYVFGKLKIVSMNTGKGSIET